MLLSPSVERPDGSGRGAVVLVIYFVNNFGPQGPHSCSPWLISRSRLSAKETIIPSGYGPFKFFPWLSQSVKGLCCSPAIPQEFTFPIWCQIQRLHLLGLAYLGSEPATSAHRFMPATEYFLQAKVIGWGLLYSTALWIQFCGLISHTSVWLDQA